MLFSTPQTTRGIEPGEIQELASIIVQPTTRKGNQPGAGSLAPPGQKFEQQHKGATLTFNNTGHDSWQTLIVAPGDSYYPRAYVLPRRLGLHFGISF